MHRIDLDQLEFVHPKLREIMREIDRKFGEQIITSMYRIGDPGVHGCLPLRGIDIRCRGEKEDRELVDFVNNTWKYDYKRPAMKCAIKHDTGQGLHIHLQVHPNTARQFA